MISVYKTMINCHNSKVTRIDGGISMTHRPRGNLKEKYSHDDVIKWKHFPRYWPFVRGIHRPPVNSPHKGQWRGALMFSLIWWFETLSRPLWRHCNASNRWVASTKIIMFFVFLALSRRPGLTKTLINFKNQWRLSLSTSAINIRQYINFLYRCIALHQLLKLSLCHTHTHIDIYTYGFSSIIYIDRIIYIIYIL